MPSDLVKKFLPWIISLLFLVWVIAKMIPVKESPGIHLDEFGRLPVLVNGRVMPMDTLARLSLLAVSYTHLTLPTICSV